MDAIERCGVFMNRQKWNNATMSSSRMCLFVVIQLSKSVRLFNPDKKARHCRNYQVVHHFVKHLDISLYVIPFGSKK